MQLLYALVRVYEGARLDHKSRIVGGGGGRVAGGGRLACVVLALRQPLEATLFALDELAVARGALDPVRLRLRLVREQHAARPVRRAFRFVPAAREQLSAGSSYSVFLSTES